MSESETDEGWGDVTDEGGDEAPPRPAPDGAT